MNAQTEFLNDHGEAMDRMYRWQRHIYDASRRYYLLGRNGMLANLKPEAGQSVLEIGCGTGRNLKVAAELYPTCHFYGIDISHEMLKSAHANLSQLSGSIKVRLAQGDATNFEALATLGQGKFDRIYFSYTLSMVPQWQEAVIHALSLLADRGELHIVDFGQCEKWPRFFKRLMFGWLRKFDVSPRARLQKFLYATSCKQNRTLHFFPSFAGYVWSAVVSKPSR